MVIFNEIIGWYGAAAILLAYALLSFGVIAPTDVVFQLLNGTGALGVAYISLRKRAYQPGVLNVVWAIIAIVALIKIII